MSKEESFGQQSAAEVSADQLRVDGDVTQSKKTSERLCDGFLDRYATMMNHDNLANILAEQNHMLATLEVANEKIASLNQISEKNYLLQSEEFRQNIRLLGNTKRELDSVFRRIRSLKSRLAAQYPVAYSAAEAKFRLQEEDESVEDEY